VGFLVGLLGLGEAVFQLRKVFGDGLLYGSCSCSWANPKAFGRVLGLSIVTISHTSSLRPLTKELTLKSSVNPSILLDNTSNWD